MENVELLKFVGKANGLRAFTGARIELIDFLIKSSLHMKCTVSTAEIARKLNKCYGTVSHHLRSLRDSGFINVTHNRICNDSNGWNEYDLSPLIKTINQYEEIHSKSPLTVPKLKPPPPLPFKNQLRMALADALEEKDRREKAEAKILELKRINGELRAKISELAGLSTRSSESDVKAQEEDLRYRLNKSETRLWRMQPSRGQVVQRLLYETMSPEEFEEALLDVVKLEIERGEIEQDGRDIVSYLRDQVDDKKLRWEMIKMEHLEWKKEWCKHSIEFCGGMLEFPFTDLGWNP